MRKLRSFRVNSDILVTFYNAVICSLIVSGSVCWGGNISKFDRGRSEQNCEKRKQVILLESHWTVLRLCMKRDCTKKLMQRLNDPTHPLRHYFAISHSKRSGRFLHPRTNENYISR